MKSILLTGATGFIGRNLYPPLCEKYTLCAPTRSELNLQDFDTVHTFLEQNTFDIIIHAANPTGENPIDKKEALFEDSMRVFYALAHNADTYGHLFYFGSGAEYGKHRAISMAQEEQIGEVVPRDPYGFSRFLMNELAKQYHNITNLRVFGCYGPTDPDYKLIPHIIRCVLQQEEIALRQNVWFDFVYVTDILSVLFHFIEHPPAHKDYNLCGGAPMDLLSIAREVRRQMGSDKPIVFEKEGMGRAYTGSNERLRGEIPHWHPVCMQTGIRKILESMGLLQ